MKKLAIIRIIPILAAVALLGGCASSPGGGAAKDDPLMDLMNAVVSANFKTVRGLISSGVDANACWTNTRVTALMEAARRGYKFILIELINAGASINAQDVNGTTALMFATQNGHMEVAKSLLEAGADPDIQNEDGWTAFSVEMLESKERARMAADEADWARRMAEKEERAALADRIIAKKYGSLFSSYSDYEAWKKRCNGKKFTYSLISPIYSGVEYGEGDMFIVEKYGL